MGDHPKAYRPAHLDGFYNNRVSIDSVVTGDRDSMIAAHAELHTAREANVDDSLDSSFHGGLVSSNAHMLQVLRADEARWANENEHSFSRSVVGSRAGFIKKLEEVSRSSPMSLTDH